MGVSVTNAYLLNKWICGESEERGHELWLVRNEVVEKAVDMWLQVQNAERNIVGLGVGQWCYKSPETLVTSHGTSY